jgi:NitT/TauT family transport system ATP-binding protein
LRSEKLEGLEKRGLNGGPVLKVEDLDMDFSSNGDRAMALKGVNLSLNEGEFACILGPSGCGKSTLLNIVAGFISQTRGRVFLRDAIVKGPGPDRLVVFQEDALFPWLTVHENTAFGLKARGVPRKSVDRDVKDILSLVGLEKFSGYLPRNLSLGMKQRVALARVLVLKPRALLMDEPFASLDTQTKAQMHALSLRIWNELSLSALFVTHDVEEALKLADTIYVFNPAPGSVKSKTTVNLERPRNPESVEFLELKKYLSRQIMPSFDPIANTSG